MRSRRQPCQDNCKLLKTKIRERSLERARGKPNLRRENELCVTADFLGRSMEARKKMGTAFQMVKEEICWALNLYSVKVKFKREGTNKKLYKMKGKRSLCHQETYSKAMGCSPHWKVSFPHWEEMIRGKTWKLQERRKNVENM